jgi:hypothetical protein
MFLQTILVAEADLAEEPVLLSEQTLSIESSLIYRADSRREGQNLGRR